MQVSPSDEFENFTWDGEEWVGAVSIPYFGAAGHAFLNPLRDEVLRPWGGYASNDADNAANPPSPPSTDSLDFDVLFRDAKFLIRFETAGRKRIVPRAQRTAWQKVGERGDAAWQGAIALILADYQVQRPSRVKWWKATYGDLPFDRELPQINDIAELLQYCRPYSFKVHVAPRGTPSPDRCILHVKAKSGRRTAYDSPPPA